MSDSLLQQGIAAARAGNRELARRIFTTVVQQDPASEQGWLWLSGVVDDPARTAYCLQRVLAINPHNSQAQSGLRWARSQMDRASAAAPPQPPAPPQPAPAPSTPQPAPAAPLDESFAALIGAPSLPADPPRRSLADLPPPPSLLDPISAPQAPPPQPSPPLKPAGARPSAPQTAAASPPGAATELDDLRSIVAERPGGARMRLALGAGGAATGADMAETMSQGEAIGYSLLLGAVFGLNATMWAASGDAPGSFLGALALAALGALLFAFLLLPAWLGMAGVLLMLAKGALDRSQAFAASVAGLLPGFLAAVAFLSGVARYLLPSLSQPLGLLQMVLLAIAVVAVPVALYNELRRYPALAGRALPLLTSVAALTALLLGVIGVMLGSLIVGGLS